MTASKLSLIVVLLSVAASAAAAESPVSLYCGPGKLDLACPSFTSSAPVKAPIVGFAPLDERYASQAYVVRWGEGKKNDAEPRWIVSLGNRFRQALFWAAVASVLL